jgi:(p)ppGpp synthase/HD superfamily hydrolase
MDPKTDLVARARAFAAAAHGSQTRKYTGEPYIVHPIAVAETLAELGHPDETVAAALLHDVVEDCGVTLATIEAEFGPRVAELVEQVTDVSRPEDGKRAKRKELDRLHLAEADPEGKSIKLADLIDNTKSIVVHDPHFASVYLREMRALLPVLHGGDPRLHERAARVVSTPFHVVKAGRRKSRRAPG